MPKGSSPFSFHFSRQRLLWLAFFLFTAFAGLIFQFYKIQIVEGEKWAREGRKQHFFVIKEPYRRGLFYSNTSMKKGHPETPQPFVIDVEKFHLFIDPYSIPEECRDPMAYYLMSTLDLTVEEQSKFRAQFDKQSRSRRLAMWLDRETCDQVLQWWLPYARSHRIPRNALFFASDYQRSYPFGKLLGQVLHTVQNQRDEVTQAYLPTGGLELQFQSFLEGKEGKRRLMRSPRHALEIGEVVANPENGADIYLTINHYLQAIAEEEVAKGVKKSRAKAGWAVMMHPRTGEILAMAQYPFFNPPEYRDFFNDPLLAEHTRVKAITEARELGSIMKPFTLAIALMANEELVKRGEQPLFDIEEKIAVANGQFPGRTKPISDTHLHHYLNMWMGLYKSSNIYMGRLVERIIHRLGSEWYRNVLNQVFGFGEKTGIELPAESRGVLPAFGKKHPNGKPEWSVATPYSLAMGYNIQATSLQMLRAMALVANGGCDVQPTLIRKIVRRSSSGKEEVLLDHTQSDRIKKIRQVISPDITQTVVRAMKYCTKPGSTGRRAEVPGYTEAGKTGTAMKVVGGVYSEKHNVGSFVGFVPAESPEFILIVSIDEPEYGYLPGIGKNHNAGVCAAPVFSEISRRALEYLGRAPDDPYGYPPGDPRYDKNKADWLTETRRLQEHYEAWNKG